MANKCLADDGRTTKEAPDSPSKYRRSKRKGDKQWLKPTNVYGGSGRIDVLRTRASWNHRNDPSRGGGRNRSFTLCSRALDSLFGTDLKKPTPRNDMPAFDAANVLGVFMWQGGWAALAAFGLLAALVAMSQAIVVATSAGAKEMLAAISAIKNQAG
jgi:hypothetical protein